MNKLTWIIFSVLTVGILGLLVVMSGSSKIDVSAIDTNTVQSGTSQNGNIGDHIYSNSSSQVILIEYADFQCPGCSATHTRIKPIIEDYKQQIQFIFRNFPLSTIHANAKAAAGAAEAAGLQGKYWEMNDKIYDSQSEWESLSGNERNDFFANFARDLGLDINKFNSDMSSKAVADKINFDTSLGKKINVDATPTFYLNGNKLSAEVWGDDSKFKDAINAELIKNGINLPN